MYPGQSFSHMARESGTEIQHGNTEDTEVARKARTVRRSAYSGWKSQVCTGMMMIVPHLLPILLSDGRGPWDSSSIRPTHSVTRSSGPPSDRKSTRLNSSHV